LYVPVKQKGTIKQVFIHLICYNCNKYYSVNTRGCGFLEQYIKSGLANLWKGKEAVGGKLYLSNNTLTHKPHKVNVQTDDTEIKVTEIKSVDYFTSKVLGLPLIKNGLTINTADNMKYKFVVNGREKWKQAIEQAK
jgi:hypothetical protein